MAQEKQDNTALFLIAGVVLFFGNKLLGKSEEDKKGEKETEKLEAAPLVKNPFAVGVYKLGRKKGYYRFTLTIKEATKAASLIQDGIGNFADDEAQIMGGIKYARTKSDITYICMIYSRIYKRDLYTDLKKNLDRSSELGSLVNAYVNKLPEYSKTGTLE